MGKLSFSLILVVILSILSLGWGLNQVYIHKFGEARPQNEYAQYLKMGEALASTLAHIDTPNDVIKSWNENSPFTAQWITLENLPVPEALKEEFYLGKPLLLAYDEKIEAYFLVSQHNSNYEVNKQQVLSLSLPSSTPTNSSKIELILTLIFYFGVTLILILWVWPLIRNLIKLRTAAIEFGKGNLDTRTPAHRFSYLNDIEKEFNNMAERIQSLIQDNKLLSRAVSHDLKTPLARLRFGLDALAETEDPKLREKYAKRVDDDLEEMESLINTLLQFARLDEYKVSLHYETLSLEDLCKQLCQKSHHEKIIIKHNFQYVASDIQGDRPYLTMLINNVIGNALAYANTQVNISLTNESDKLILRIEDDGDGIDDDEYQNVFKPFWRGSQSRGQKGHGMGLAVVARIAEWHGIDIDIGPSVLLGGACFIAKIELCRSENSP